ncbi:unnamed protein product [Oikopleura dioica]|uniref:Adenosine 5'-monophosphoramidase HINT3 n=1 Tax=Oikopleura dioica TaxID=34765 RepID=E4WYM6_OIKDI|nr:unnamed protein product [Oikopleura dioica]
MKSCCLFCSIIGDNKIQKVYEDDTNVIIKDIRPAADLHFLVLPRRHIRDITTVDDAKILDSLLLTARAYLPNFDIMEDKNVGFHQPPFNSQHHLHMHIVAGRMNGRENRRILNPGWADINKA